MLLFSASWTQDSRLKDKNKKSMEKAQRPRVKTQRPWTKKAPTDEANGQKEEDIGAIVLSMGVMFLSMCIVCYPWPLSLVLEWPKIYQRSANNPNVQQSYETIMA